MEFYEEFYDIKILYHIINFANMVRREEEESFIG